MGPTVNSPSPLVIIRGLPVFTRRSTIPAASRRIIGTLTTAACIFSAGFNLAFFLMMHHMSHLVRMESFGTKDLTLDLLRRDQFSCGTADKAQAQHATSGGDGGGQRETLLSCDQYGGPSVHVAAEMVYWKDIPSDSHFASPFKTERGEKKYLTFEPDNSGFNNKRMSLETVVSLAHAMGRTLVLPPKFEVYLLNQEQAKHDNSLHFADFFDFEALSEEHSGLEIVSMEQFLQEQAVTGRLSDKATGEVKFPPGNRTNWDLAKNDVIKYLRSVAVTPDWSYGKCIATFPSRAVNADKLKLMFEDIIKGGLPSVDEMSRNPLPVNASTEDRMREMSLGRGLCIYDDEMQDAHLIHFPSGGLDQFRLLVHFYAFIFFEDWRHDLHLKRLVRDHLRYLDELQCAAARVVAAVRERARRRNPQSNPGGVFDSMHIRRGDFHLEFKPMVLPGDMLYNLSKAEVPQGTTLYIATDERDRTFFRPFAEHYDVCYLGDFQHLLKGLNRNYYGMLDQLIASRGRTFYGTFQSTFTAYINRLRGYHADKRKLKGHEYGIMESYYFFPKERKLTMKKYASMHQPFWQREFPAAWRDIDKGAEL